MRRLIAAAVLAAVIVSVCVVGQQVIRRCGQEVGALLMESMEAAQNGDTETAAQKAALAEETFTERENKLNFFIRHDLVEDLGSQLAKLKDLATEETASEFLSEAGSAVIMLTHVVDDERPTFLNIF